MQSEGYRPLGGSLPTSLSEALGVSPYILRFWVSLTLTLDCRHLFLILVP